MLNAGKRLRRVRKHLTLNLNDMALLLRIAPSTLSRWENSEPRLTEKKRKFLASLGVNPAFIDYGQGYILLDGKGLEEVTDKAFLMLIWIKRHGFKFLKGAQYKQCSLTSKGEELWM